MSRLPELRWAQRVDKVYITVLLPDAKNAKVNLEPEKVFTFSATAGAENHLYELKLNLFDKVNVQESKRNIGERSIFCVIEKAKKGWWKKLVAGNEKTPHYVKCDWDKWVDEDEDKGDLDLGGIDFSNLGGMDDDDFFGRDEEGDLNLGGMDFSNLGGTGMDNDDFFGRDEEGDLDLGVVDFSDLGSMDDDDIFGGDKKGDLDLGWMDFLKLGGITWVAWTMMIFFVVTNKMKKWKNLLQKKLQW